MQLKIDFSTTLIRDAIFHVTSLTILNVRYLICIPNETQAVDFSNDMPSFTVLNNIQNYSSLIGWFQCI